MTTIPTVKYAKSGDVSVAYMVVGDAGPDLVLVPGWASHVEYLWNDPPTMPWLRRLASFSRLIMLDRRGTGLSDRVGGLPSVEARMDDVRVVMDAAGSERAVLFGVSEGGSMCVTFAATYPERTSALILYGAFARLLAADGYPVGFPPEEIEKFESLMSEHWGTGVSLRAFVPSMAEDAAVLAAWARAARAAVGEPRGDALAVAHQRRDGRAAHPARGSRSDARPPLGRRPAGPHRARPLHCGAHSGRALRRAAGH
ncbi:MAG: alpha/beta hydrolase [Burkholderiales bacterium]